MFVKCLSTHHSAWTSKVNKKMVLAGKKLMGVGSISVKQNNIVQNVSAIVEIHTRHLEGGRTTSASMWGVCEWAGGGRL